MPRSTPHIKAQDEPRLWAKPVARMLCKTSGSCVGYLYMWNNGETSRAWLDRQPGKIMLQPIDQVPSDGELVVAGHFP